MLAEMSSNNHPSQLTFRNSAFRGWIGVARRDMTPSVGIYSRSWGAAEHDTAEGVHRPLVVTVLTLSTGSDGTPFVLAAIDGGAWASPSIVDELRRALCEKCGSDENCILLSLTHTHAGAPLFLGGDYHGFPGGEYVADAFDSLRSGILEAASESIASRVECDLTWNYGRCALAANRELPDPNSERFLVGFNPQLAADDRVLVGRITDMSGCIRATLVNYACHPTSMAWGNRLLSPDYVGALRELVESHTGGAVCMFLQGASGELSPQFDFSSDPEVADAQGRQLGWSVLSTLEGMLPPKKLLRFAETVESGTPLGKWKLADADPSRMLATCGAKVNIELKSELPTTKELELQLEGCTDRVAAERIRRQIRLRGWIGEGTHTEFPLWVWQIGDSLLVAQPGEAYSQLQVALRDRFPDRAVAVLNLVNGSPAYLPPADRYGADIYAVSQTPYARGALESLQESAIQTCDNMLASALTTDGPKRS